MVFNSFNISFKTCNCSAAGSFLSMPDTVLGASFVIIGSFSVPFLLLDPFSATFSLLFFACISDTLSFSLLRINLSTTSTVPFD